MYGGGRGDFSPVNGNHEAPDSMHLFGVLGVAWVSLTGQRSKTGVASQ